VLHKLLRDRCHVNILVNLMAAFLPRASSVGTEHLVLPVLQRIPYASLCLRHTVMCSWHSTGRKVAIRIRQASRTWFNRSVFKVLDFGCLSETTLSLPESRSVLLLLFFSISQNKCCFYQISHLLHWYKLYSFICMFSANHGRPGSVMYFNISCLSMRLYI